MFENEYQFNFYQLYLYNKTHKILLVELKVVNIYSLSKLKKNIKSISENIDGYEIVLGLEDIDAIMHKALINNNIPYFTSKEEVFLPFIYLHFNRKLENYDDSRVFTAKEQMIFCFLINEYDMLKKRNSNHPFTFFSKDISLELNISISTIQKTLNLFLNMKFITKVGNTKNAFYVLNDNLDLKKIVKQNFRNPIREKKFYEIQKIPKNIMEFINLNGVMSSETALANSTLYNSGNIEYMAFDAKTFRYLDNKLRDYESYDEKVGRWLSDLVSLICLEEWIYEPDLNVDNEVIDYLSLYKCLEEKIEIDDRMGQEIEKYSEGKDYGNNDRNVW